MVHPTAWDAQGTGGALPVRGSHRSLPHHTARMCDGHQFRLSGRATWSARRAEREAIQFVDAELMCPESGATVCGPDRCETRVTHACRVTAAVLPAPSPR